MEKYLKRKSPSGPGLGSSNSSNPEKVEIDDLPWDPCERKPISSYNPNQKDEIRRAYLLRGPCQPKGHEFPQCDFSGKARRFNPEWFNQYPYWLKYSVKKNKAFCLVCYLFKESGQKEAFVTEGFDSWNKSERLVSHVGDNNSFHNKSLRKCQDLLKQDQSVRVAFEKQSDKKRKEYRIRLSTSVILSKSLLNYGLPFRGHDESKGSLNRGTFLEFLKLLGEINESIGKVILGNAPKNNQMTSPKIQKDICNCFAQEVLKRIFEELGDDVFSFLVDESRDTSKKEQMAMVLRYVDKFGVIKERFIGLVHVMETSALSLKLAIDELFARYNLSLKRVRGQGYDGASNMSGEFNGLKALIMKENSSAYYVHCFAPQLQLVVVALANKHTKIYKFFEEISTLTNVVCASCKRIDMIREAQREELNKKLELEEVESGSGLNQEISLARVGDTRWSSHYKTLVRLYQLYPVIIEVLEYIEQFGTVNASQKQAEGVHLYMKTFDFVYYLHLMKEILEMTNVLCEALQKKDQDILNAVGCIKSTKQELQTYRLEGFDSLMENVTSFCEKYDIETINMEVEYIDPKYRRRKTNITNRHHYEFDNFNTVLDMQIQEFGNRFNEVTTELLTCMGALSPHDNCCDFDIPKIIRLAEMYPYDFDFVDKDRLKYELHNYLCNVKEDTRFENINGILNLAKKMVETRKHVAYSLVYRLLKLSLVLPVATASVERCFSSMKHVKTELRNRMGDDYMNDSCICYIEKEFLANVSVEDVMDRFQKMKTRREQL